MKERLDLLIAQIQTDGVAYAQAVSDFKRAFLTVVLRDEGGNQLRAARVLGVHRNTLRRLIRELQINPRSLRKPPARTARTQPAAKREA